MRFQVFRYCLILALSAHPPTALALIGYGSSDAVYSEKNQEYFFDGFNLAIDRLLKGEDRRRLLKSMVVIQKKDQRHLSALRAANQLVDAGASFMAGFPTSHEALLVSKVAKKEGLVFISAAASHSDIRKKGKNVFSLGESALETTGALLEFVSQRFPAKKGFIVTDKAHVFSENQTKTILESNKSRKSPIEFEVVYMNDKKVLPEDVLDRLRSRDVAYVALSTYADDTIQLLEQFIEKQIDIPIIANSSWTIGNIGLVRRLLVQLGSEVYCVSSVIKGATNAKPFESAYFSKYGRMPETEMYYGYDMGVVVATTLNRLNGDLNRSSFKKALYSDLCFDGTTTGRVCFPESGGHVRRKINWLKFKVGKGFVESKITKAH